MSNILHLPALIHLVCALNPKKVLDVGIGMGTYGFLLRQHLDISRDRLDPREWKTSIHGIEIFPGYKNPVWDYAYDKVEVADIRVILNELGQYDVVICNDVLEHLKKDDARSVIQCLLKHSPVLISTTPNREYPQGIRAGNEAERHLSLLVETDFPELVTKIVTGVTTIYICCSDRNIRKLLQNAIITCPSIKEKNLFNLVFQLATKLRGRIVT